MKSRLVTATDVAAKVVEGRYGSVNKPIQCVITNVGTATLYIGGADVDSTDGYPLASGLTFDAFLTGEAVWGVCASGATTSVNWIVLGAES